MCIRDRVTPFMVAIFSIPILKIHVGAWKWTAIIIGFLGAFVIIDPPSNEVFSIYSILPLGASFGYGTDCGRNLLQTGF